MEKIINLLKSDLDVISMGLHSFTEALEDQNVKAHHVDWKPPAGDPELLDMLDRINQGELKEKIRNANWR